MYDDNGNYTIERGEPSPLTEGAGVCIDKALNNPATEALDKIPPGTIPEPYSRYLDLFSIGRAIWNSIYK